MADGWHESEFNVVGEGGGSAATFNAGTKLTVEIDLTDGTNDKPGCAADHGTTGETNNLNLGTCKAKPGKKGNAPFVQFTDRTDRSITWSLQQRVTWKHAARFCFLRLTYISLMIYINNELDGRLCE